MNMQYIQRQEKEIQSIYAKGLAEAINKNYTMSQAVIWAYSKINKYLEEQSKLEKSLK